MTQKPINLNIGALSTVHSSSFFRFISYLSVLLRMLINGKGSYSRGNLGMFISAEWERSMQNLEYHSDQWCREKNA